jgi:group I intron endonuclease
MIIYKITNTVNNKSYIGQTVRTLRQRKNQHISESKRGKDTTCYIHNAIRKHGDVNFKFEIIDKCKNIDELNEKEIYHIEKYNTLKPNGYNLTEGGNGTTGYVFDDETKKRISESNKKSWKNKTPEQKKEQGDRIKLFYVNNRSSLLGKKRPEITGDLNPAKRPEVRKKISEKNSGNERPDLSERNKSNFGKTYEEIYGIEKATEIKTLMSKNRIGIKKQPCTEEQKENQRQKMVKYEYEFISPTNERFVHNSLHKFAKDHKLSRGGLHKALKNGYKCKGWTVKIINTL